MGNGSCTSTYTETCWPAERSGSEIWRGTRIEYEYEEKNEDERRRREHDGLIRRTRRTTGCAHEVLLIQRNSTVGLLELPVQHPAVSAYLVEEAEALVVVGQTAGARPRLEKALDPAHIVGDSARRHEAAPRQEVPVLVESLTVICERVPFPCPAISCAMSAVSQKGMCSDAIPNGSHGPAAHYGMPDIMRTDPAIGMRPRPRQRLEILRRYGCFEYRCRSERGSREATANTARKTLERGV